MEKSALAVRVGDARHAHPLSHTKLQCMLQLRGQIHSTYFISTLYVLCGGDRGDIGDIQGEEGWMGGGAMCSRRGVEGGLKHIPPHRLSSLVLGED